MTAAPRTSLPISRKRGRPRGGRQSPWGAVATAVQRALVVLTAFGSLVAGSAQRLNSVEEGSALALELRSQRPAEPFETTGVLKLRDPRGRWQAEVPVRMDVRPAGAGWETCYEAWPTNQAPSETLCVTHALDRPNRYDHRHGARNAAGPVNRTLAGPEAGVPFAGSEFWLSDLGLEFLHWPQQRILKTEMRKGRSCKVLESVTPEPAPGGYARVLSWIDIEHRGLVRAEAYDAQGKLFKEFSIGSFKKVDGRWQLKSMEIRNEQTDARTRLEFDLELDAR